MEKKYTEIISEDYKGLTIGLKASYYMSHKDALAKQGRGSYLDGNKCHAVVLVVETYSNREVMVYKESIAKANRGDFIGLYKEYIAERGYLLAFAKNEIDKVAKENEITLNLEDVLREEAFKQSQRRL